MQAPKARHLLVQAVFAKTLYAGEGTWTVNYETVTQWEENKAMRATVAERVKKNHFLLKMASEISQGTWTV